MRAKKRVGVVLGLVVIVVSVICVVTAVRIEWLDHLSDGAIERKAEQEPNSKWRIGMGEGFYEAYRKAEKDYRRQEGLSDEAVLSSEQWNAIRGPVLARGWEPSVHDRLGNVLGTWGLAQYPLALFLIVIGCGMGVRSKIIGVSERRWWIVSGLVGVFALGLAVMRGYFSSLAW